MSKYICTASETHLDETFQDGELLIQGYNICCKDRNANGGGVAVYIQSQIPVKIRYDLMKTNLEIIWLQVPHLKPILVSCCYRPPNSKTEYLDSICDMLHNLCDTKDEVFFLGDLNIDWSLKNSSQKTKLAECAAACFLTRLPNQPE